MDYLNSNIYENPYEDDIVDLSDLGVYSVIKNNATITQKNHCFTVGDVLYYNPETQLFGLALATNSITVEAVCIVSEILDKDNFIVNNYGDITLNRYTYDTGSTLYLSEAEPGKLITIQPTRVIKPIGTKTDTGININIQRGLLSSIGAVVSEDYEEYTQDELDEIIKNIW